MFHEVIYPGGLDVTGRILVDRQSFEMCLSASDLCRFVVPQIIREQAALSFDDEIKAFLAIHLHENRPIGIVGSKRRRHFEPAGELGVNLHGLVLFELFGESALDAARVIDNMLEHGFMCVLENVLMLSGTLLLTDQPTHIDGPDANQLNLY